MARKTDRTGAIVVAEVMEAGSDTKPFQGKSFSITGHLSKPRAAIVALIEQAGGRFEKEPRFGTTYLITNQDWSGDRSSSKKLQKAIDLGVKLLKEEELLAMLVSGS